MASNYKKIISRFDKLVKNDIEEAKRYFLNIVFSSAQTSKLTDKQLIDFFLYAYLRFENEIEFIFDIMNKSVFIDKYSINTQKEIFFSLLKKEASNGLITGEAFTKLLKAYSVTLKVIDNTYVKNILDLHKRLDYDAIFYILKSPYIYLVDKELIDNCLNELNLYESTMDKSVLELISNANLIKILSENQIKQLVERVSKNIGKEKSLRFVFKVISNKNIVSKYLKNDKLFDFEYLNGNKVSNITTLLISVGFYDKYFDVEDKLKVKDMILKMMEYDPLFLSYFKISSINKNTINIDVDILYGIIKSNYQNKLIEFSTFNKMGKHLAIICNYLHRDNMYCNQLIARLFNNISAVDLDKTFINELNEYNVDVYTHYLLNNLDFNIPSINQYEFTIMSNLNYAYLNDCSIDIFKNDLVMNRYGFSYKRIKEFYFEYGETIELVKDESIKREFKEFKDIIFNKDKKYLYSKYMTNIFSFDKANRYEQKLKEL